MEAEFVAATVAEQRANGIAEICAVLNRLPPGLLPDDDRKAIKAVDRLMDDLYRRDLLICPGHRWLSEPPESISGHATNLLKIGALRRDPSTGQWTWQRVTSYFTVRRSRRIATD
jgi:glyoxylase-like metal-dependent hydrolase (beta-lactamase superfamily II)